MKQAHCINVRQRQYGFAVRGTKSNVLVTENVLVCTAWFGMDISNSIAFICHFDGPKSTEDVPRIVKELEELVSTELRTELRFESHILNGTPALRCLRADITRASLKKQISKLPRFNEPTDHKFLQTWKALRSSVMLNVDASDWMREDYLFHFCRREVSVDTGRLPEHGTMVKAKGSA